ncbi:MAG: hypothetical protein WCC63_02465 [Candidatus Bathyarchaeia archaeon]
MKKEILKAIIVLLITAMPMLATPIPAAKGDFPSKKMPIVYVDPEYSSAPGGTLFNVSVKVFNLTDSFYRTDVLWNPGRELPPPGTRYNYSLGSMYGFTVRFSWNPLVLEYDGHVIKTPVENYPDGVLHGPLFVVQSELNSTAGTYSVSQSSWFYPVAAFNCPNRNATILVLTFKIKREEPCLLRLEYVELVPDPNLVAQGVRDAIPLLALDGAFTPENTTRVASLEVGAPVGTQLYTPVISGENACVRFMVRNGGRATDFYNLTLYEDDTLLESWVNEGLASGESEVYNFTFSTSGLRLGLHTITVKASISHERTPIADSFTVNFILIQAPSLSVGSSSSDVYENETVVLNAIESVHQDPNIEIQNYTWLLYEPGAIAPMYEYEGESVTHRFAENGTWKIVLLVEDNWSISYDPLRNATVPYMEEVLLDVQGGDKPQEVSTPTLEQVLLVAVLSSFAVIFVVVYLASRKRVRL